MEANDVDGHDKDDDGGEDGDAKLSRPPPEDGAGKDDWGEGMAVPRPAVPLSHPMASRGIVVTNKRVATAMSVCRVGVR